MLNWVIVAALALQQLPPELLDRKVREGKEPTGTALDEMTVGQLLKLTALPGARLSQIQCAGYAHFRQLKGRPVIAPERLASLRDALGDDAADFADMKKEAGRAFVLLYADEARETEASMKPAEWSEWQARQDARCASFFKAAADGSLVIRPLPDPAVVDPMLASCHALYRAAAARASGEEKASLSRDADRAAALALKGKEGAAKAAAEAALAAAAQEAATAPALDAEPEMMQLVLCVPKLRAAEEPE